MVGWVRGDLEASGTASQSPWGLSLAHPWDSVAATPTTCRETAGRLELTLEASTAHEHTSSRRGDALQARGPSAAHAARSECPATGPAEGWQVRCVLGTVCTRDKHAPGDSLYQGQYVLRGSMHQQTCQPVPCSFIIIIPLIKVHHSFWLENPIKTSKHFSDSDVSGQKAPWREFLPLLTGSCRSMWVSWFI